MASISSNNRRKSIGLKMTSTSIRVGTQSLPTPPTSSTLKTRVLSKEDSNNTNASNLNKHRPTSGVAGSCSTSTSSKKSQLPNKQIASTKSVPTFNDPSNPNNRDTSGRAPPLPDFRHVKSKIGSLENVHHTPGGGKQKVFDEKVDLLKERITAKAKAKVGSKQNIKHIPGGGDLKIYDDKAAFIKEKQITAKVGSKENIKFKPQGGNVKIYDDKGAFIKTKQISAKIGSLDNINHTPKGGDLLIYNEKLSFKEAANSKIDAGAKRRIKSSHSNIVSPTSPSSTTSSSSHLLEEAQSTSPISLS